MKNTINKIANHYGIENQTAQAIEEMAELIQALSKARRRNYFNDIEKIEGTLELYNVCGDLDNLAEEIADVNIMLQQLSYLYDVEVDVDKAIVEKLTRQVERMRLESSAK